MDYGPIAHHGTCLDNQFSTSENSHDESKTLRKGPISQERWGEDDGSAPHEGPELVAVLARRCRTLQGEVTCRE
jgi:hypothetical protein